MEVSGETGCVGSLEGGEEETAAVGGERGSRSGRRGGLPARVVFSWPDSCQQSGDQMEQ